MEQEETLYTAAKELGLATTENTAFPRQALVNRINELLQTDFSKLVGILYRIDVSERRLRTLLDEQAGSDAADLITDLILERQLQKIQSRQQYSRNDNDMDENEKW